jgi:glycosyltransferase involved in cell wall biosynthesis
MVDVSIIIPNYNSGNLLERCLISVLEQTFTNWEAIIVDNNSTDESRRYLEKLTDTRFRVYQIDNQGVIAKSRNLAATFANGRYLAFLDADDWWEAEKLSAALRLLDSDAGDLTYHRLRRNPRKFLRPFVGGPYARTDRGLLRFGNRIPNSSVVMRASDFESMAAFDESESLVACEDFDLWERLSHTGVRFIYQRDVLGSYHEATGTMNSSSRRIINAYALVKKHKIPYVPGWLQLAEILSAERTEIPKHQFESRTPLNSYIRPSDLVLHYLLSLHRKLRQLKH